MAKKKVAKKKVAKKKAVKKTTMNSEEKIPVVETGKKDTDLFQRMSDRLNILNHILAFRQFLGSGFEPVVTDLEIIVCFADVRGFTNYCRKLQQDMQDRKIQNFLKVYVKIFNEGLMQWIVEHTDEKIGKRDEIDLKLEQHIVPNMYKNLGDGLMMTWEVPPDMDFNLQGRLTQEILLLLDKMAERFYYHFRQLTGVELDAYSNEVTKLDIGFGVAKGHAWRLDFGHSIDYAGSVINLASRLESYARPRGIVALYDVSPWLFDSAAKQKSGCIARIENIKGYDPVKVWLSRLVEPNQIEEIKIVKI